MSSDSTSNAYAASLRAYELGRVRSGFFRAISISVGVAIVAFFTIGKSALPWAFASLPVVVFAEWRGQALMHGARRGVMVGAVALLVPLSLLRPCCDPAVMEAAMRAGTSCCDPWCCVIVGALMGVLASFALPRVVHTSPRATVVGFALGAMSVAVVRCTPLLFGESLGLLSGLFGALIVSSAARAKFSHHAPI